MGSHRISIQRTCAVGFMRLVQVNTVSCSKQKALTRGRTDNFSTKNSTNNKTISLYDVHPQPEKEHFFSSWDREL